VCYCCIQLCSLHFISGASCLSINLICHSYVRPEGMQEVKDKVKPYDWTYTTNYKGTLSSIADSTMEVRLSSPLPVSIGRI